LAAESLMAYTDRRIAAIGGFSSEDAMREITLTDAKASLSLLIGDAVRGEPSIITRHGKRAAVVIAFDEWERLTTLTCHRSAGF
jgi:prevent-host-death family protein